MGSAIKSENRDRENEKRVEKLRPVGQSKAMTASWCWGCHLTSITNPSDLTWVEGKVSVLVTVHSWVHWLPFPVQPDSLQTAFLRLLCQLASG